MTSVLSNREEAPFGEDVWKQIDEIVVAAASSQLAGRRVLEIEGPYGLGLKAIPGTDRGFGDGKTVDGNKAELLSSSMIPLAAIQATFRIPIRDIAAFEREGIEFDAIEASSAAIAAAQQEDSILFFGAKEIGVEGLTTLKSAENYRLSSWEEVGKSVDDIIAAVNILDKAGFPGPYTMALSPGRYNLLFRRFMQGNLSEFDLIEEIIPGGIVKAPILKEGGVLLAKGRQFASVALGQDLAAFFIGPVGAYYEFALIESVALRVRYPRAIVTLT